MDPERFDAELERIEHNQFFLGLATIPVVLALVCAMGSATRPVLLAFTPYLLLIGAAAAIVAWRKNFRPRTRTLRVRADPAGIHLGEKYLPRRDLRAGFVKPVGAAPRVVLRRKLGLPVELQARSTAEARTLLRALGLDVSQTIADFFGPSRLVHGAGLAGLMVGVVGFVVAATATAGTVFSPLVTTVAIVGLTCALLVPTRLRVGADGIDVRWLHTRRFLAYAALATVERYESGFGNSRIRGLRLSLRSGERLDVALERGRIAGDKMALAEERIREGREAAAAGDVAVDAALLQRGGQSLKDWLAELRAIGTGANATLRTAPVPRDRLMRVALDPNQPARARAAAAVALGAQADEDDRARLRHAAEATAAPKLRIAIERAATGADDDAIEEALQDLEREASAGA